MRRFRVAILDEAEGDLDEIRRYVAEEGSEPVADRLVEALLERSEKLASFPGRGAPRPDLGRGVRTLVHKRAVIIVYRVGDQIVEVVGFCYRGRNVATAMENRM